MAERVLLVEDDAAVRRTLARILKRLGYECDGAARVAEARAMLDSAEYALIVCDIRMPDESGMALVEEIEKSELEIAVLMATAVDDPEIAQAATGHGVDGYLIKPFTSNEFQINVEFALEQSRRRHQLRQESDRSSQEARERTDAVRSAMVDAAQVSAQLDAERTEMLDKLSRAVGERDLETGEHIDRTGRFARSLAQAWGLSDHEADQIGLAAPMHDIGKVAVPDAILLKSGALTPDERTIMQRHAEVGYEILANSSSPLLDLAATIALTHHERWDGGGYPRGLAGEDIPIAGRIVAIVDAFDAISSERPYREAMSIQRTLEIMRADRGKHFDPKLFDCFLDNVEAFTAASADS